MTFLKLTLSQSLATAILLSTIFPAQAQTTIEELNKQLATQWIGTIQGDPKTRTLIIKSAAQSNPETFLLDASYGFSTQSRFTAVKAEIAQNGAKRKLTVITQSDNTITAEQQADGSFEGYFFTRGAKASPIKFVKATESAQTTAISTPVPVATAPTTTVPAPTTPTLAAQTLAAPVATASSAFLTKQEVDAMSTGKKWKYSRMSDGQTIRWDLRSGGNLFGNNLNSNMSDSGSWSINDEGQLCTKWRGSSIDGCFAVQKDGDKFKMFNSKTPNVQFGVITVE
jgi:hypothetical protein